MHQSFALSLLLALAIAGCRRPPVDTVVTPPPDAGTIGGVVDAGPVDDSFCELINASPDAGPSGGIVPLPPGPAPSVKPPQSTSWVSVSSDPECKALTPGPLPPQVSWTAPSEAGTDANGNPTSLCWADATSIDGHGNFATSSYPKMWFVQHDGGAFVLGQGTEDFLNIAPGPNGFVLLTDSSHPLGYFMHLVGGDSRAGPAIPTSWASYGVTPNPLGGFVERRSVVACHRKPVISGFQVRWLDDALRPLGDWHTVNTWEQAHNNYWNVVVDQTGKALVLWFVYPQQFGGTAAPSSWKFGARWMAAGGPVSEPFDPVTPIFTPSSQDGFTLFAGWGSVVSLPEGGFVMFQYQMRPNSGGTVSPTGWYARYPSGEPPTTSVPSWLQQHEGSLQLLAGANGYVTAKRDPTTCARTMELIGLSGQTCFRLPVEGSDLCDPWDESVWPDGTLLLKNICQHRFWPGIARPAK